MGTMKEGSKCCKCGKDISNEFGVQCGSNDYCTECIDKLKVGVW